MKKLGRFQEQYDQGRLTRFEATYRTLLELSPENVEELGEIEGGLADYFREYVRSYNHANRTTFDRKVTLEQVALARAWLESNSH